MNDPHVEWLVYRLETAATLVFQNPEPREDDTSSFHLRLEDGRLTVTMKDHYASVEEARRAVWPFLDAWELDWALSHHGRREMKFTYESHKLVDRDPPPLGASQTIQPFAVECVATVGVPTVVVGQRSYPPPPSAFRVSPDVETLWDRYERSMLGREPLQGMGYFCLSSIEATYGGASNKRQATATALGVHVDVLGKIGELTSTRGDAQTARKGSTSGPLTDAQTEWLKAAIREIIRRAGMLAAGSAPSRQLTMADLPRLPP
jgi:hypothetical protein